MRCRRAPPPRRNRRAYARRRADLASWPIPAEVDLAHALIGGDLLWRTLDQDAPAHHDDDAAGEAEDEVHVVLDEEDGDLLRQAGNGREQLGTLVARHAGCGLVE